MNHDNMNNNITNLNQYRENMMSDTSSYNINNYPQTYVPEGMVNGGGNLGYNSDNNVEEFVSEEFVNSYLNSTNQNTPDLWSRIEAGFEEEAKDIVAEQRRRSVRTKKVLGFVAAAALITIIAVPVMMSGMFGAKEESTRVYDKDTESATMAEEEMYYDESSDSVANEALVEGSMDETRVESATEFSMETEGAEDSTEAAPSIANNSNSVTTDQGITDNEADDASEKLLKEIEGVQTDDRKVIVVGEFIAYDYPDIVIFEVEEIVENNCQELDIKVGDKITLSNPMYILTFNIMIYKVEITLDSVSMDEAGNITGRIIDLTHLWMDETTNK